MINVVNYFLIVIALIWIIIAVIQDFRKREVANWLNFSLIVISLTYRAFISIFSLDYRFFVYGLIGFAIFFILANIFYYGRVFAGGDAKLLMALGAVLPFSLLFYENLEIFIYFIFLLMICGSIYGLIYSIVLSYKNKQAFSKEFLKQFSKNKKLVHIFVIFSILIFILVLFIKQYLFIWFFLVILLFPFLYIYAKALEESCLVKLKKVKDLTVGDWLYKEVKVGKKVVRPHWEGLTEKDLAVLKKSKKKILIKEGIPFTPAFLVAFIVLILLRSSNWCFR